MKRINKKSMVRSVLFFAITLLIDGCASPSKYNTPSSKYFQDVFIYSLQGINEVEAQNYPNVEIVDSAKNRLLIYHIDSNNFIRRVYRREENTWVCNIFEKGDTADIFTTRTIYPDKLFEVSYTDTFQSKIYDVGLLIKDTMEYFKPLASYNQRLTLPQISEIAESAPYKVKFWNDSTGTVVKLFKQFNNLTGQFNAPIITCYPKKQRSFFWWFETSHVQNSVPCK